jgi:CubicO group peptidase (beta-lactamase class C family)
MQPDDVIGIASTTKAFTGATVLKVVETGQLSLDDTLGDRLPEIAQKIEGGDSITLRQLLNGTSGVPDFLSSDRANADIGNDSFYERSPEEIIDYIEGIPRFTGRISSPIWAYTNTADIIASLMVESATGKPFAQVMREQVLDPLGLEHTSYGGKEPIAGNLARSYFDRFTADGTPGLDGIPDDATRADVALMSTIGAAGALFSNIEDVTRFTQALFGGELLSSQSLKELTIVVPTDIPSLGEYGLGIIKPPIPGFEQYVLAGDALGYSSLTSYLTENGSITGAFANRFYRLENNDLSTVQPPLNAVAQVLEASVESA